MRNIIFRGKAKADIDELVSAGEWITGQLVYFEETPYIVGPVVEVDSEYIAFEYWLAVDPKTVGQYAGVRDKSNKWIFEGDVFEIHHGGGKPWREKIIFHLGAFMAGDEDILSNTDVRSYGEVIGNIYDNPELVKEDSPCTERL